VSSKLGPDQVTKSIYTGIYKAGIDIFEIDNQIVNEWAKINAPYLLSPEESTDTQKH
jgi:hypothetical protein